MSHPQTSHDALWDPVIMIFVQNLQETLGANLREVWLFGSRARGESNAELDYDGCVVVDADTKEAERGVSAKKHSMNTPLS